MSVTPTVRTPTISEGAKEKMTAMIADALTGNGPVDAAVLAASLIGEAETGISVSLPEGAASTALAILREKAVVQRRYWETRQGDYPGIEVYTDEDGVISLPADIGPLLSGYAANGRYSEADWWKSTIETVCETTALASVGAQNAPSEPSERAVSVVSLEWIDGPAEVPKFGLHYILFDPTENEDGNGWYVLEESTNTAIQADGSERSALAAAQADFETRVQSVLRDSVSSASDIVGEKPL